MEKEKSGFTKFLEVVLLIFVLVLGMIGGFLGGNYLLKLNDKETTKTTTKKEEKKDVPEALEISDPLVTNLFGIMDKANGYFCGIDEYYKGATITSKDLPSKLVFGIAINQIYKSMIDSGVSAPLSKAGDSFSSDTLRSTVDKIFGKKYTYTDGETIGNCPVFNYNPSTKSYVMPADTGCGGTCRMSELNKVVKATKTSKNISIFVRHVFIDDNSENILYYKDFRKTKQITTYEKDEFGNYVVSDSNMALGSLYKFEFTKEDSNYIFASVSVVEE